MSACTKIVSVDSLRAAEDFVRLPGGIFNVIFSGEPCSPETRSKLEKLFKSKVLIQLSEKTQKKTGETDLTSLHKSFPISFWLFVILRLVDLEWSFSSTKNLSPKEMDKEGFFQCSRPISSATAKTRLMDQNGPPRRCVQDHYDSAIKGIMHLLAALRAIDDRRDAALQSSSEMERPNYESLEHFLTTLGELSKRAEQRGVADGMQANFIRAAMLYQILVQLLESKDLPRDPKSIKSWLQALPVFKIMQSQMEGDRWSPAGFFRPLLHLLGFDALDLVRNDVIPLKEKTEKYPKLEEIMMIMTLPSSVDVLSHDDGEPLARKFRIINYELMRVVLTVGDFKTRISYDSALANVRLRIEPHLQCIREIFEAPSLSDPYLRRPYLRDLLAAIPAAEPEHTENGSIPASLAEANVALPQGDTSQNQTDSRYEILASGSFDAIHHAYPRTLDHRTPSRSVKSNKSTIDDDSYMVELTLRQPVNSDEGYGDSIRMALDGLKDTDPAAESLSACSRRSSAALMELTELVEVEGSAGLASNNRPVPERSDAHRGGEEDAEEDDNAEEDAEGEDDVEEDANGEDDTVLDAETVMDRSPSPLTVMLQYLHSPTDAVERSVNDAHSDMTDLYHAVHVDTVFDPRTERIWSKFPLLDGIESGLDSSVIPVVSDECTEKVWSNFPFLDGNESCLGLSAIPGKSDDRTADHTERMLIELNNVNNEQSNIDSAESQLDEDEFARPVVSGAHARIDIDGVEYRIHRSVNDVGEDVESFHTVIVKKDPRNRGTKVLEKVFDGNFTVHEDGHLRDCRTGLSASDLSIPQLLNDNADVFDPTTGEKIKGSKVWPCTFMVVHQDLETTKVDNAFVSQSIKLEGVEKDVLGIARTWIPTNQRKERDISFYTTTNAPVNAEDHLAADTSKAWVQFTSVHAYMEMESRLNPTDEEKRISVSEMTTQLRSGHPNATRGDRCLRDAHTLEQCLSLPSLPIMNAWKNQSQYPTTAPRHLYRRPQFQTPIPTEFLSLSSPGATTGWQLSPNGTCTWLEVQNGFKLVVFTHNVPLPMMAGMLMDDEYLDRVIAANRHRTVWFQVIVLKPGDRLIMRPNTPYLVYAVARTMTVGGYFYTYPNLPQTLEMVRVESGMGDHLTNSAHPTAANMWFLMLEDMWVLMLEDTCELLRTPQQRSPGLKVKDSSLRAIQLMSPEMATLFSPFGSCALVSLLVIVCWVPWLRLRGEETQSGGAPGQHRASSHLDDWRTACEMVKDMLSWPILRNDNSFMNALRRSHNDTERLLCPDLSSEEEQERFTNHPIGNPKLKCPLFRILDFSRPEKRKESSYNTMGSVKRLKTGPLQLPWMRTSWDLRSQPKDNV